MTSETEVRQHEISRWGGVQSGAVSLAERLLVGLRHLAGWSAAQLARPRVRNAVIGVLLILIGAFIVSAAFWAFLLVVVGLAMLLGAWAGSRLEGRLVIEWSDAGAGFEMRARFKSAQVPAPAAVASPTPAPEVGAATDSAPTIEGEAHTVELDLEELKALVAAAEHAYAAGTTSQTSAVMDPVSEPHAVAEAVATPRAA